MNMPLTPKQTRRYAENYEYNSDVCPFCLGEDTLRAGEVDLGSTTMARNVTCSNCDAEFEEVFSRCTVNLVQGPTDVSFIKQPTATDLPPVYVFKVGDRIVTTEGCDGCFEAGDAGVLVREDPDYPGMWEAEMDKDGEVWVLDGFVLEASMCP